MFVQLITAKVRDKDALQRLLHRWVVELRPGAAGFLGATVGVTADGTLVDMARFASREAAAANAARPAQGSWWAELEACLDGPATFRETEDIEIYGRADLDRAGFVQAMEGTITSPAEVRTLFADTEALLLRERPDLLGGVLLFHADGTCTELAYFSSEAEARAAERGTPTPELAEAMRLHEKVHTISAWLDLASPTLL